MEFTITTTTTDGNDDVDDSTYDAMDVFFQRGEFLRKLRELEAQDDAERQIEAAGQSVVEASSSDTLHYESYLQTQLYHDDLKHINYKFVDFGYITTPSNKSITGNEQPLLPLMIEQDRSVGKGGIVWDAGVILAEHVIHVQDEWKSLQGNANNNTGAALSINTMASSSSSNSNINSKVVTMCELGAGTGVTGLMIAAALPHDVHVSLTDLPELMPLLNKNLAHNNNHNTNLPATVFPLAWGTNVQGNYDVILGSDVVAGIYDPIKLAKTIWDLCHDKTIVYLALNSRLLEIIATFEAAMVRLFDHVERRVPVSRNKNPNVSILVVTGKRSNQ